MTSTISYMTLTWSQLLSEDDFHRVRVECYLQRKIASNRRKIYCELYSRIWSQIYLFNIQVPMTWTNFLPQQLISCHRKYYSLMPAKSVKHFQVWKCSHRFTLCQCLCMYEWISSCQQSHKSPLTSPLKVVQHQLSGPGGQDSLANLAPILNQFIDLNVY